MLFLNKGLMIQSLSPKLSQLQQTFTWLASASRHNNEDGEKRSQLAAGYHIHKASLDSLNLNLGYFIQLACLLACAVSTWNLSPSRMLREKSSSLDRNL